MSQPTTCPVCHGALDSSASEGLCPKCLWASLFEGEEEEAGMGSTLVLVGDYELLSEIARGGMGIVYRARQTSLNRIVALKMVLNARLPGEAEMKRFRAEAEAVAGLEHPNIVPIYDVGEDEGRPYFTMKYVAGGSLAERLSKEHKAREGESLRAAISLMAKVARAVHYAHQRGVIHRDLKPSNILLDEMDEPLVTDFGLARQLEGESSLTLSGSVLGTPAYISPEQAMGRKSLSTAADVYSLGAILHELMTGRVPFAGEGVMEVLQRVMHEEPSLKHEDRDLETICVKCLQKHPAQRYRSAEALAEDLERWLRNEPIHARPATPTERIQKWVRRHPARAALVGLGLVAPAVIIAVLLVTGANVRRERNIAQQNDARATAAAKEALEAKARIRQNLYAADMLLAQHALDDGNLSLARELLSGYLPSKNGGTNTGDTTSSDLRGFEWRLLWKWSQGDPHETIRGHTSAVYTVAFSRDSRVLASGDAGGKIKLRDMETRREIGNFEISDHPIFSLSFSGDGNVVAAADELGETRVWDIATKKLLLDHQGRNPVGVRLSPTHSWVGVTDGKLNVKMAAESKSVARVVDWSTGREVMRVMDADFEAFSPDGTQAFVTREAAIGTQVWDVESGRLVRSISSYNGSFVVSPDGGHLAGRWSERNGIILIDAIRGVPPVGLTAKFPGLLAFAFSADSRLLASVGSDQTVRIWDLALQRETGRLYGHVGQVRGVAFSGDGKWIATGSTDQTMMLWPTTGRVEEDGLITNIAPPYVLSPEGSRLAAMGFKDEGEERVLRVWELGAKKFTTIPTRNKKAKAEFFSADGRFLWVREAVTAGGGLPLVRWDLAIPSIAAKTNVLELPGNQEIEQGVATDDGLTYAANRVGVPGMSIWRAPSPDGPWQLQSPGISWKGIPLRFSPTGAQLVSWVYPNQIQLSKPGDVEIGASATLANVILHTVNYSPDGKLLAVTSTDHMIRVLETTHLTEVFALQGHAEVIDAAFSPDGLTLASCGLGGVIKLWSLAARREVYTMNDGLLDFASIGFGHDGNTLVAGGWGKARIIRVPSLTEIDRGR